MNAELGFGVIGGFRGGLSWPELQFSKYEAGVNVPMACAAEVLSLVSGLWPPVCPGGVLAENWNPSLAEVLSLGLRPGAGARGWDGLDWVGRLWASSSKEKRHGNETVARG